MSGDYDIIKIPRELVKEIDEFVGKYGYTSRAEFVKDATRRLITDLSQQEARKP